LFVFGTSLQESLLDILAPVGDGVALNNLNLEEFVVGAESGKSSQRLTTGTTHTEQEGVTEGLSDDSLNSGDVITSIQEHDQVHLSFDL
jgi:hypothetical protein